MQIESIEQVRETVALALARYPGLVPVFKRLDAEVEAATASASGNAVAIARAALRLEGST